MKLTTTLIAAAMIFTMAAIGVSCGQTSPSSGSPNISGELPDYLQKTTIQEVERVLKTKLAVPNFLPSQCAIREVYWGPHPNSSPTVTDVVFLISDGPIQWDGDRYQCKLVYELGWNQQGGGLKMPWAEYVPSLQGRLETKEDELVLWWESPGDFGPEWSTARLRSNIQFSKDELIKIAESTKT